MATMVIYKGDTQITDEGSTTGLLGILVAYMRENKVSVESGSDEILQSENGALRVYSDNLIGSIDGQPFGSFCIEG